MKITERLYLEIIPDLNNVRVQTITDFLSYNEYYNMVHQVLTEEFQ